jgi:hypothetical protein
MQRPFGVVVAVECSGAASAARHLEDPAEGEMNKLAGVVIAVVYVLAVPLNGFAAGQWKNKFSKSGASDTKVVDAGVGSTQNLNIGFSTDGEGYFVVTECIAIIKAPPIELGSDTPMAISLEDGSDLSVSPVIDARAKKTFLMGAWNRKKTLAIYGMSREDVETMAESSITSIEISYKVDGEMAAEKIDIKPKISETIRQLARCILSSDEP